MSLTFLSLQVAYKKIYNYKFCLIQLHINALKSLLLFWQSRGLFFLKDLRTIILKCRSLYRYLPVTSLRRQGPAFHDSHWWRQKNPESSICKVRSSWDCCCIHSSASRSQLPRMCPLVLSALQMSNTFHFSGNGVRLQSLQEKLRLNLPCLVVHGATFI